jgi:hypothetical protein
LTSDPYSVQSWVLCRSKISESYQDFLKRKNHLLPSLWVPSKWETTSHAFMQLRAA